MEASARARGLWPGETGTTARFRPVDPATPTNRQPEVDSFRGDRIADIATSLAPRVEELERLLFEAQEELARHTEDLEAARQINRELLARLNQQRRWPPSAPLHHRPTVRGAHLCV